MEFALWHNSAASEAEKVPPRAKVAVEDRTAKAMTIQNVLSFRDSPLVREKRDWK